MNNNRLKELLIVLVMILIAVFFIELQYIFCKLSETPGLVYLGAVHYPSDYFYYLSQMIQGKDNFLTSTMLFTSEKLTPVYVGWQNVLTGKILLSLGFSVIEAYQVAVFIYLTLFLALGYILLCQYFLKERNKRLLAFFFFLTSTSLWKINFNPQGPELAYFWYWYNHGDSLVRFGPTPHHLMANSAFTALLLLSYFWFAKKRIKLYMILLFIVCSIILTSITPVYWGLMVLTLAAIPFVALTTGGLKAIKTRLLEFKGKMLINFTPLFFVLLPSIPVAIYVKKVFTLPPYSYSSIWESQQYVGVNLYWLIVGSGLVIPLAFLGLKNYIRSSNSGRIVGLILLTFSSLFYFSPIYQKLGVTNVRFWSGTIYLIWGALGAEGVFLIISRIKREAIKKVVIGIFFLVYLISILPTYYVNYKAILKPQLFNSFYYLPKEALIAFQEAAKKGNRDSVYLVEWPFDEPFPALTGRKSLFGFRLLTIDAENKTQKAFDFFGGKMTDEEKYDFLKRYKIDYIVGYPWTPGINDLLFLKKEYENNFLGVYKVELEIKK
jgi:hypothetical protein